MSYLRSETVDIACDSNGASTAFTANLSGMVQAVEFIPGTLSSAAAVTIKGENSSRQILTVAALSTSPGIWYPRSPSHRSTSGSTFGVEGVPIPVVAERVRFVVSSGGNGGAASFRMIVG